MSVSLVPGAPSHRLTEAAILTSEPSESAGWRLLGDVDKRKAPVIDLDPAVHRRMQDAAMRAYRFNPIARRLIEHQVDFVLGNGLSVNSSRPDILSAVRLWWHANEWPRRIRERLRSLYIYGEWLHIPSPGTDVMKISDVVPTKITAVERDEYDHGQADAIIIDKVRYKNGREADNVRYKVIRPRDGRLNGDVFFFALNRVTGNMRGVSELLTILDYAQIYDDILFSRAERVRLMSQIYWDVTINGMSEREVAEWLRSRVDLPPAPGSIFAHNESVSLTPTVPNLRSEDHSEDAQLLKSHILTSAGWPGIWFDDPSAGRASAQEMAEPAYRHVVSLQTEFSTFLRMEIDYFLQELGIERSETPWDDYTLSFNRPSTRDLQRIGPAMSRIADFAERTLATRVLAQSEARQLVVSLINQLGLSDVPLSLELPAGDSPTVADETPKETNDAAGTPHDGNQAGQRPAPGGQAPGGRPPTRN